MGNIVGECLDWLGGRKCRIAVEALKKHGFDAEYFDDSDSASIRAVELCDGAKSVGLGGSMTVEGMDIIPRLEKSGVEILRHYGPGMPREKKVEIMHRQQTCPVFLCSANAVGTDGVIVNIDGCGNRVSASVFGPGRVVLVVGRNKIVMGGAAEALARAKAVACPANARRLDRKTPCAKTGVCSDCDSPERICNVTVIFERRPSGTEIHVLVVNEDLGL